MIVMIGGTLVTIGGALQLAYALQLLRRPRRVRVEAHAALDLLKPIG